MLHHRLLSLIKNLIHALTSMLIHALILVFIALDSQPAAQAAMTVTDVSNASRIEGLEKKAVTIYGGVGGSLSRCDTTDPSSLCNNCNITDSEAASPVLDDSLLFECNNHRIHPDLVLVISASSDAVDGTLAFTSSDGTVPILPYNNPPTINRGTVGQIALRWSDLCQKIIAGDQNSGGVGTSPCTPASGHASLTFRVGVSSQNNNRLDTSTDDYQSITLVLHGKDGTAVAPVCSDSSTDPRICYFEMGPGDSKAIVRTLQKPNNNSFPNGANVTYKYVRFLFDERDFGYITSASSYVDLPVEAQDSTNFNVNPRRIEGLTNEKTYYFRAAIVDIAGNINGYTGTASDHDCSSSPIPGDTSCHIVKPSEVVGVLDHTNCFIATAAYGSPFAEELTTLRDFRDQVLKTSQFGQWFIKAYYRVSPPIARIILKSETLRSFTRKALVPFVWFAGVSLARGKPSDTWLWILGALALAMAVVIRTIAERKSQDHDQKNENESTNHDHRSPWSNLILAFSLSSLFAVGALTGLSSYASAQEPVQEISPLEEAPPVPEYPYPGATEVTPETVPNLPPVTDAQPQKKTKHKAKFSDTKTPVKSNGWVEKPSHIGSDGDFIYETNSSTREGSEFRDYGTPSDIKFSETPGREVPQSISKEGEFRYKADASPTKASGSLGFGLIKAPTITNPTNGVTFSDVYGTSPVPALLLGYEYPFTKAVGHLGAKFETGFIMASGQGRFKDPARAAEKPEEHFTFLMVPLQATLIYRIQFADTQWFYPFIEGGGVYYGIAEIRDDGKTPHLGGSPGIVVAGGASILLDWIDRRSIHQLEADYGIHHVWLTLQLRQITSVKKSLDLTTQMATAGFTFDF